MLKYSELTVVKNSAGIPTALGYPINSFMLQNNKPLFVGGKKPIPIKKNSQIPTNTSIQDFEYNNLAVPAGLVCMTKTVCTNEIDTNEIDTNEIDTNEIDTNEIDTNEIDTNEIVPESLYDTLMALAETSQNQQPPKTKKRTHRKSSFKKKAIGKHNSKTKKKVHNNDIK